MHRLKRVALIGASVRAAAQSAARAGLKVTGIDRFGDQDTLQACQDHLTIGSVGAKREFQTSQMRSRIATIAEDMPIVPVGGLAGDDRAWLESDWILSPWPTQKTAIRKVREVKLLHQIVAGTSFLVPPTISKHSISNLVPPSDRSRSILPQSTPWLRKNASACGGLGTRWHERDSPPSIRPGEVMQQWVEGRPHGATFLSNGTDTLLLGVCRSLFSRKGEFPFVYSGSLGPVECRAETWESLTRIGQQLVAATQLRGLFNIDYIEHPDGTLWLLEINPRWSGSSELIECQLRQTDNRISLMKLMLEGLNGNPMDPSIASNSRSSEADRVYLKRIVFARHEIRFDRASIVEELDQRESIHDVPEDGQLVQSGDPICTLIQSIGGNEKDPMRRHRVLVNLVANH